MSFTIRSRSLLWAHQQSSLHQLFYPHQTLSSSCCSPCLWKPSSSASRLAFRSAMDFKNFSSSADSDPSPFKYVPVEEVEKLEKYQASGYHPILIGDVLHSRYRVVHKLGYGTYSTTWLCRDSQSNKYVAVKVGTAESNTREVDILDYLSHSSPLGHPSRAMIPSVQDRFVLQGPNGTHPCYATALAMCSISAAKDGSYKRIFQASTARSLVMQLVLAVEYIHANGIVHGG